MTPGDLGRLAADELARAQELHRPMASAHEGYAVILEELDELWQEVRKKHPDKERMREEALQVAAMALRFVHDVTDRQRIAPTSCRTCGEDLVTGGPATGDGQCIDCRQDGRCIARTRDLEAARVATRPAPSDPCAGPCDNDDCQRCHHVGALP